jgi:DNA-directed RNA polymerase subunit RPC12/RpoP
MAGSYACAYCGELGDRDISYRCALCSSASVDEADGALFCDNCGEIRKGDLSVVCGLCGAEELAINEPA